MSRDTETYEKKITVNLYDVLNIASDSTQQEIKDAYKKLVALYHPDKPTGDAEMFELVTHAYGVLHDPNTRRQWDDLYTLTIKASQDHFDLKKKHKDYVTALNSKTPEENLHAQPPPASANIDFQKTMDEMDRKHKFSRDNIKKALTEDESNRLLRDYTDARDNNDIEDLPERLFTGEKLDNAKFNAVFESMYGQDALIPHSGNPGAWNDYVGTSSTAYSSIDNYNDLYSEAGNAFGSAFDSIPKARYTAKDIDKIQPKYETRLSEEENMRLLDKRVEEYKQVTNQYNNRNMSEFHNFESDPTFGGYGFSHQIGITNIDKIGHDDAEEIKHKYMRLLEMRKNN